MNTTRLKFAVTLLLIFAAAAAGAQAPAHHWGKLVGGHGDDSPTAVGIDSDGNIITAGFFRDTLTVGGVDLIANGDVDIYLAKFDKYGTPIWSKNIDEQEVHALAVDYNDDIIITGRFTGTVDFGGGGIVSAGLDDIFLAKYDADGNHLWSQGFGSTSTDIAFDVDVNDFGDIVITGEFRNSVDFGGGPLGSTGGDDIFLAKFDGNGVHLWSRSFGTTGNEVGWNVAFDGLDKVIMAGRFSDVLNLGGSGHTPVGGLDLFVARYQQNGNLQWSQSYGSTGWDYQYGLAIDGSNNIILAGTFVDSLNIGGGLVSAGLDDIYLAKLDQNGTHLWSQRFGDVGNEEVYDVVVDPADNLVITGYYGLPFDLGGGNLPPQVASSVSGFIAGYDANGSHMWSEGFIDSFQIKGRDVATDGESVVLSADITGGITVRGQRLVTNGGFDAVLVRFVSEGVNPFISLVTDVGNDQGRQVEIEFLRSTNDDVGSGTPVVSYEVYRQDGPYGAAAYAAAGNVAAEGWTYVGSAPAHGDFSYSMLAPTLADSTISMGDHNTTFFIRAATATPTVFFDSPPDSGHSLDNLAPLMPANLMATGTVLSWDESEAADFDYFTVYGSAVDDFGAAVVIDYSVAPTLDVTSAPYSYYYVTATDESGNESIPATLGTATGVGDTPRRYVLSLSNYPNPFNPRTTVKYTVPAAGPVSISVYNARGARVATLVDNETRPAGAHSVEWSGRDESGLWLASGVYFARIEHAGIVMSRKMILLK